jgi:hypothetical protein
MAETEKEPELLAALLCRQPVRVPSGQISALRLEARLEVAIGIVQRILDLVRHGTHSHPADLGEVLGNSIPPWARNQPWLVLPSMPAVTMDVPEMSYRSLPTCRVDLGQMTCSCSRWIKAGRNKIPLRSVGRCCTHLAGAVHERLSEDLHAQPWSLAILRGCTEHAPPPISESAIFSNGESNFLALYDVSRGYVQLYDPEGSQFGYDSRQNRWGWGGWPKVST